MKLEEIIDKAENQDQEKFKYCGDVYPEYCYDYLKSNQDGFLIDVRTEEEWKSVGVPDLQDIGGEVLKISWRLLPDMRLNKKILQELEEMTKKYHITKQSPLFFLCKSGARSLDAAIEMTKHGYKYCFNIANGFEGDKINQNRVGFGWQSLGLPYTKASFMAT